MMAATAIPNPLARAGQKLLGEMLLESGKITAAELERALELQQTNHERLGKLLVDLGALAERDLLAALGQQLAVPVIESAQFPAVAPEIKTFRRALCAAANSSPLS